MAVVDALSMVLWTWWKALLVLLLFIVAFIYKIFRPGNSKFFRDLNDRVNAFVVYILTDYVFYRVKKFKELKTSLFSQMDNRPLKIVEVGIGSGTNFDCYPEGSKVYGIEPNTYFEPYLRKNQQNCGKSLDVVFTREFGENMESVDDSSIDAVVLCQVLCSVKSVANILREAKRILKKDGVIYLLQHDAAEKGTWMYTFQKLVAPMERFFCNCDLFVDLSPIYEMGFSEVNVQKVNISLGLLHNSPHSVGTCKM